MGNAADLPLAIEGPVPPSLPAVSVDLTVTPVLSSALARSALPVVPRLTLTSDDADLRGATLRLSVHDADGEIGAPVHRLVDLDAGRTTVLGDPGLALDPDTLLRVRERRAGWVRVELEAAGELLVQRRVPVQVLPAGHWLATPLPLALELLAAHVRPADPAVTALVTEAAALLEEGTGSGTMGGYADDAERIDEVVEALTWAMRRREIRAAEPPASWTGIGQRVRTPGEVLDGRTGSALDTVVTLAAALERTGLRPLLWLVSGGATGHEHAFLGYWRQEPTAEAATTDVPGLVELIDAGAIRLVETVLLTDRGDTTPDLHGPAHTAWLSGDLRCVLGVTDVHRARQAGVPPLPTPDDGTAAVPGSLAQVPPEPADDDAPQPPARVRQWQEALLDRGARARLVDCPSDAGLPLVVPDDALGTLADLVDGGATLTLLPGDRLSGVRVERGLRSARELPADELTALLDQRRSVHLDVPETEYASRLRSLARRARTVLEQTGANDLYLTLGSLVREQDGRRVRAPLLLMPVVLGPASATGVHQLSVDESAAAAPNWLLLEGLRRLSGADVPGLPAADPLAAVRALGALAAEHRLPWHVEPTAELAVLPFASARLAQDLTQHWPEFAANPLVGHLLAERVEPFADPVAEPAARDLDELAAQCPLPADATQLRVVAEAGAGRTFVVEGPPGTGKSQTLTNLVTRAVGEGKRVLVVAGKRTALDVVARRLDAIGMGPFALDLHGKGSRPAVVRAQVRAALDHAVEVDAEGLAADAEDLRSATRTLAAYAEQLHAQNPAGTSFWSAHAAALAADPDIPALPVTRAFAARADADVVTAVRRALALLPDIAGLARPSAGHAWGFLDTVELDITAVQQAAAAVDTAIRELPGEGGPAAAVRAARTPEELDTLVHLLAGPRVGLDVLDEVRTPRWAAATADVTAEVAALVGTTHAGFDVATPAALALPLAELSATAHAAVDAGFFARRGQLAGVLAQLGPSLRPDAAVKPRDVPALVDSLRDVQAAVHDLAARAATIPGLQVPAGWNPFSDAGRFLLDTEVRWLRRAAAAVDGTTGFAGALRRFLSAGPVADPGGARTVARLRDAVSALLEVCSSDSRQLAAWCGEHGLVLRWTMTRPERGVEYVHPMSLRRWVSLLDTLEPLRLAGLTEARAQLRIGAVPAEDAVRAFDRGLAEASMAERLDTTGLNSFDDGRHELTLARYAAAARAVRSRLTSAVPAGVLAARSSAAASGEVGALQRALAEGLGVAELLATHGELITAVLPCVLAGPDSVARFLPATAGLFDLVVFDEASQLRVADAVGALGRAKAAVVVGDSAQLPPTSAALTGADDTARDADAESLLTACLRAGLPRRELTWHYRSQDESLIAFSNAHHYGGRLSSFPAPSPGRAISLLRVDGTFLRSGPRARTNPVEAAAVVAEVQRRFRLTAPAVPSIGVVTLDPAQRTLIEDLLRDSADPRVVESLDRADGLLVATVDDVQGDERDVVLLSPGASPDAFGRLPLDLGPIGRRGGERWLNVAVTRARREVVVVASFAPEQLRAQDTASIGVAHLRAYLDLAAQDTVALPRVPSATDLHRDQVAVALRERGLVVRTDVGLSGFRIDLTVARPEAPDVELLAVLLDGPAWAGRATVGDRDGLPAEVLADLRGWPAVERVRLPAWLTGSDEVLDRLVAAVDAAAAALAPEPDPEDEPEDVYDGPLAEVIPLRPERVVAVAEPEAVVVELEPAPVVADPAPKPVAARRAPAARPAPLDEELPFTPWSPRTAGEKKQLDRLSDPAVAKVVRRVLAAGLKAEGPVHRDRLARLTAGAFGFTRISDARRDALLALLPKNAVPAGEFIWPAGLDRGTWSRFRRQATGAGRPLEHVAPEEVGNAMVALARADAGLAKEDLYARTLEVFGQRRRTPAHQPLLDAAFAAAVAAGRLGEQPDGVVSA